MPARKMLAKEMHFLVSFLLLLFDMWVSVRVWLLVWPADGYEKKIEEQYWKWQ